ncbi:MAG: glycine zipper 2TM domain-containing protein [Steroidobacteraceae bacterium]
MKKSLSPALALLIGLGALALTACGNSKSPAEPAAVAANDPYAAPVAPAESAPEAADPAAELAAREQELAAREAELALQQREADLARREAELAARQATAKPVAPAKTASTTPKPAATPASTAAKPTPVVVTPINVPAGTPLSIELTSGVNTKTAAVGKRVEGRLTSDVVADGRVAARAGTVVIGSVTEVVSGSAKIGGTPTLALAFDTLTLASGVNVPISARYSQQGASDTGKDAAKIVGGTAAGAVIGHQVDDDKGTVIGGVIGGAAGAIAAQKTGGEVRLPAGTVLAVTLDAPFEVSGN